MVSGAEFEVGCYRNEAGLSRYWGVQSVSSTHALAFLKCLLGEHEANWLGFVLGLTGITLGVFQGPQGEALRSQKTAPFGEKRCARRSAPFSPNAQLLRPHYSDRRKRLEDPNRVKHEVVP